MNQPIFSTCRIRPGRYLWGVWDGYDLKREEHPLISGISPTHEEARADAIEAAGPDGVEVSSFAGSWFNWNRTRYCGGYSVLEIGIGECFWVSFLWYDLRTNQHGPATEGVGPTLESAYSQAISVSAGDAQNLGPEIAERYRTIGRTKPHRLRSKRKPSIKVSHFEEIAFRTLEIDTPESIDEVKEAYRTGALKTHPDAGGDTDAFVRLESAYRIAIEFCKRNKIGEASKV